MRSKIIKLSYCFMLFSALLCGNSYAAATSEGKSNGNVTFTDVAGEHYHFLALDSTGHVWSWGSNVENQLGEIPQSYRVIPVQIQGVDDVKLISAGYGHSTAVKSDGTVWKWGSNSYGVLGKDPNTVDYSIKPIQVAGIDHVKAISDSAFFTLAIKEDGTVWSWGRNDEGQLGIGRTSDYEAKPIQIAGLKDVAAIYADFSEGLALTSDGRVWTWGNVTVCGTEYCEREVSSTPTLFEGLQNVKSISQDIALLKDGSVVKWGLNFRGSMGLGTLNDYYYDPAPIPSLNNITAVSKTRALTADGHIWSWGRNERGQVGDNTQQNRPTPVLLPNIDHIKDMTSGEETTVVLTEDGKLFEWGDNRNGEISGDAVDIMPPTAVPFTLPQVNYTLPIPRDPFTWTFLDDKDKRIKDHQLYLRVKPYSEGLAAVQRASNQLWTFINVHGQPAFSNQFTVAKDFHQGVAAVKLQDGWHFVKANGKFLNQVSYQNADSFSNGLAPVMLKGKWGYIGLDGEMKITPQFASGAPFENGMAAVQMNGKWGFINLTGKLVIKSSYSAAGSFSSQLAAVKQNDLWGYMNKAGVWVIKPRFQDAKGFTDSKLAPVKINGKWGYINATGKLEVPAQYEDASTFQEGCASIKKNGLWAIIQNNGKLLTPFQFVSIQPFKNNKAWAVTKADNGYISINGSWSYKAAIYH
ncbi:alpha-tubulin suppressor-like RCC1 family protein [Paenibacillus taihuensis]|uniref:Alpha-tubulin suppressor-like RCC1 family protein n=1 Tax=Paenibacillus taihuensis TaxID=1156355 RepID=A0A3D9S4W0_9BACL|nr:WG repeat-containing protein [Paenibacillus taihuensis]REE83885.1 alpha-tubulin suppressor-like RCC1 family protein [Paenibacillus taihuensis]